MPQRLEEQLPDGLVNEPPLEEPDLVLAILDILFVHLGISVPLFIELLEVMDLLGPLLHHSEVDLIPPSLEVDMLIALVDLDQLHGHLGLARVADMVDLTLPLLEVREEPLAEDVPADVASSKLVLREELFLLV